VLYSLVVLAAETAATRELAKEATATRDALTLERFELRRVLKQAEKGKKKGWGEGGTGTGAAPEPAPTKSGVKGKDKRGEKGVAAGAAAAAGARAQAVAHAELLEAAKAQEGKRSRLLELDALVAEHDTRQAPHLGCDRQRNDFYVVASGAVAGEVAPLWVLCREYSWVRRLPLSVVLVIVQEQEEHEHMHPSCCGCTCS
jgi:hypothetical protein